MTIAQRRNEEGYAHNLTKLEFRHHLNNLFTKYAFNEQRKIKSLLFNISPIELGDTVVAELPYYNTRPDITILNKTRDPKTIIEIVDTNKKDFKRTLRYVEDDINVITLRCLGTARQGESRLPNLEYEWSYDKKYFKDIDKLIMGWSKDMPQYQKMHIALMEADRGFKEKIESITRDGDFYYFKGAYYRMHVDTYRRLQEVDFKVRGTNDPFFKKSIRRWPERHTWEQRDVYYNKIQFMLAYIANELNQLYGDCPKWTKKLLRWKDYVNNFNKREETNE